MLIGSTISVTNRTRENILTLFDINLKRVALNNVVSHLTTRSDRRSNQI